MKDKTKPTKLTSEQLKQLATDLKKVEDIEILLANANADLQRSREEVTTLRKKLTSLDGALAGYRDRVIAKLQDEPPYPEVIPAHVEMEITENLKRDSFRVHTESLRLLDVVLTQRLIARVKSVPLHKK